MVSSSKGTVLSKVTNWQNDNIFHAKSEPGIFWHAPTVIEKLRINFIFYLLLNKKNMRKRNHKVAYAIMFIKNSWYTGTVYISLSTIFQNKNHKKKETLSDATLFVSKKQKQHKNAPIFYWNPSIKKQKKSSNIKHKYQNCSVGPPSSDLHYFL